MKKNLLLLSASIMSLNILAQDDPVQRGLDAITEEAIRGQLEFLASDWTEGRETGKKGAYLAADYIGSILKIYGLKPGGDYKWTSPGREERWEGISPERYRSYFQEFTLIKKTPGDENELSLKYHAKNGEKILEFQHETDFSIENYGTYSASLEAPVVFVGYGYVNKDEGYDDYAKVDVNGKIILRLEGFPGVDDTASEAYKKFHPEGRYGFYYLYRDKNDIAREKGAVAVIEVEDSYLLPDDWHRNYPFRYNYPYYEGDVPLPMTYDYSYSLTEDTLKNSLYTIKVSPRVINGILDGSGIDLESYKDFVKTNMRPASKTIPGKSLYMKTSVNTELVKARNVIGVVEGKNPNEVIVLGAHYDHLGAYNGYIWNGADDNASGTVGVMTIAKAIMAAGEQPEKTIVFAAWTGEEKGLLGSRYFVEHPYKPVDSIMLNLNFDMISRDSKDDTLGIQFRISYSEEYPVLEEISRKNIENHDIELEASYRPSGGGRGGSDHAPFSMKGIPFCFYMAGFHLDYHRPTDQVEKINWKKLTKIIKLGFLNTWELANSEWNEREAREEE